MLKLRRKFWLFLVLVSILISCVPSKPVEEEELLAPDRLLKRLEANRREIKNFEGSGVVNVTSSNFEGKANFGVILKKPDSISVNILGPFGIELAQALITEDEYKLYDVLNNNLYVGKDNDQALKRIFNINITFPILMDAFTGAVNLSSKLLKEPENFYIENENYFMTYIDSTNNLKELFQINILDLSITNYSIFSLEDKLLFSSNYMDFKDFDEVSIPYTIIVENVLDGQKMQIEYRKISTNKEKLSARFKIPEDVNIIEWKN